MSDEAFQRYLRQARADPAVLGVVLCGSQAMGLATAHSDYDARTILRDDAGDDDVARYGETTFPGVDAGGGRLSDFMVWAEWGSQFAWDRYSYAHAKVLHDPTGIIAPLVEAKGRVPSQHQRQTFVRGALDAFINSVYRSLKCARKGNDLCVRLEAADAVRHGLAVLFGLEGRIAPYAAYLDRELHAYPLETFPLRADELLAMLAAIVARGDVPALQRLYAVVTARCRQAGYGDVIDDWGDVNQWMLTYQPD